MKLDCRNCGAMVGNWLVVEVPGQDGGAKSHFKCICHQCGNIWRMDHHPLKEEAQSKTKQDGPSLSQDTDMAETFGVQAPPPGYYLHQGHAWAVVEGSGEVRVGLDDFSQKILGPADKLQLPATGMNFYQDHICMAVIKEDRKASFEAPVDGMVTTVNPKVRAKVSLLHDDPYGEGWLFKVKPTNLQHNLANLISGEQNAAWIGQESHRLLHLMSSTLGVTLPTGGDLVDDVYSHYPQMGWRRLVKEFFLTGVTQHWKKKKS